MYAGLRLSRLRLIDVVLDLPALERYRNQDLYRHCAKRIAGGPVRHSEAQPQVVADVNHGQTDGRDDKRLSQEGGYLLITGH